MGTLTPNDARKLGKIAALMDSPVQGEADAAAARMKEFVQSRPEVFGDEPRKSPQAEMKWPKRGTPEYFDALREWNAKYDFLSVNRSSPVLTGSDLRLIRNLARYRGLPSDVRTAERVDRLCERIRNNQLGKE